MGQYSERWRLDAVRKCKENAIRRNLGRAELINENKAKISFLSEFNNQADLTIRGSIDTIQESFSLGVSFLFNATSLGFTVSPWLTLILLISFFAYGISYHIHGKHLKPFALECRRSENNFSETGCLVWDNVILGNKINIDPWDAKFQRSLREKETMHLSLVRKMNTSDGVSSALCFIPGLILFYKDMLNTIKNREASKVGRTVGTFFQFYNTTQIMRHFMQNVSYLPSRAEQLKESSRRLLPSSNIDALKNRIKFENIFFHSQDKTVNANSFLDLMAKRLNPGRWTLRGNNAQGKTTFLVSLKSHLKDESIYIPSQHELEFDGLSGSNGTMQVDILRRINSLQRPHYILLDEWDSHLDAQNRKAGNQILDSWAKTSVIIEILHSKTRV